MAETTKVVGNFGMSGWSTTPPEMLKEIIRNYRCANASDGIVYKNIKSLAKSWQTANHDPELFANLIASDLDIVLSAVFDKATISCVAAEDADQGGQYNIELNVVINENGKTYDLYSILKSQGTSLFEDYDQTYFEFKF